MVKSSKLGRFWLLNLMSLVLILILNHYIPLSAQETQLPALQVHPLPPSLEQWQPQNPTDDYFTEVKSTPGGYLIWSQFPIRVYVEQPLTGDDGSANWRNFQQWVAIMRQAITEWSIYLPMVEVSQIKDADIIIERSQPSVTTNVNPKTGLLDVSPARAAQTNYQFYFGNNNPPVLWHRMTITIKPGQSNPVLLSAIRHELGHALGIWGHSPVESDIMYFSQVRQPTPISPRDINTLKKIYQQPTRLGFSASPNYELN